MTKKQKYYPDVDQNLNFAKMEEEILEFWNKNQVFEESIDIRDNGDEFVFYDGPPFATGLPHQGHLIANYTKDTFARYKTMKGKRVERVFGWDCHGLPAEMGVEKQSGISGRKAIEDYGIDKFNDLCKNFVLKYVNEWKHYVNRSGRWVDFDNGYKTMNLNYMESVMWVFKQLYDKGLLYEDFRVMPYSWTCQTPLSNFETKQDNSYREKADKAITVKFKLTDEAVEELKSRLNLDKTPHQNSDGVLTPPQGGSDGGSGENSIFNFLAWTTTPWTLPSNLALTINKENDYVLISVNHSPLEGESNERSSFGGGQGEIKNLECRIKNKENSDKKTPNPCTPCYSLRSSRTSPNDKLPIASELASVGLCASPQGGRGTSSQMEEYYIIGKAQLSKYKKELADKDGNFNILAEFKGDILLGLHYEPILPYLKDLKEVKDCKNCFSVLHGDFVTTTDGTGIVHTAPGFGEDDNIVCKPMGIPTICPVDDGGKFVSPIDEFAGMQVFETNDPIIIKLKNEGKWVKTEQYLHNYPHCWRTDAPLIYRAISSWYVKVEAIKDNLIKNNQEINWIPSHLKDGRFGKWLEGARDWSITRNRFFGCPVPVWKSNDPKYPRIDVYGSIAELEKDFGVKITDLHRPYIDKLTRPNPDDPTGKSMMVRVSDVLDCWFESGSMPYAQHHYPFENKEWFEKHFPADFIVEGDGQLRGWFYVLNVLSTALFNKPAFKNVISYGIAVDETGKKLSKRLGNYTNISDLFENYGSDAVRWFMLKSPVLKGEELRMDKNARDIKDTLRMSLKPIMNSYNFFCMYANSDGIKGEDITEKDVYYIKSGTGDKKLMDDSIFVRRKVFGEEQNIKESDDIDGLDATDNITHYVLYKDNNPIATSRLLSKSDGVVVMQRLSVLSEYRGKGIARNFLSYVIKHIIQNDKIKKVEFDAQCYLGGFYERLGFTPIGKEFEEVGIKHIKMYADVDKLRNMEYKRDLYIVDNVMDQYILSKLKKAIENIEMAMDDYAPNIACREVEDFFETLNNWYIRRNKNRFWKSEHDEDKIQAYNTLYTILVKMMEAIAPLLPFTAEYIWKGLKEIKE